MINIFGLSIFDAYCKHWATEVNINDFLTAYIFLNLIVLRTVEYSA